jgi:hypothetical protein
MTTHRIHNGLNKKEQKVVSQFVKIGRPHPMTLNELAEACWGYKPAAQANSWVRNSIRRPIALGVLEPTGEKGEGTYQITALGREMVKKGLLETACESPKPAPKAKPAKKAHKAKKAAKPAPVAEVKVEAAPVVATPPVVVAPPAPAPVATVVEPKVETPAPAPVVVSTPTPSTPTVADLMSEVKEQVSTANEPKTAAPAPSAPWMQV